MRTPAGKDCRYYYEDFHRGRDVQECRLIKENSASLSWRPGDCSKCLVPEILNANASPNLELKVTVKTKLLGFGRQLTISAACTRHKIPIEDPYIGCKVCNENRPELDLFREALENTGSDD